MTGCVVFVIPAKAGIQGVWDGWGILFLSSAAKNLCGEWEVEMFRFAQHDRLKEVSG